MKLLEPFDLHGLPLSNRVVMAPLTRARAGAERIPNDLMTRYYTQRAGAGLIISEATSISPSANGWVNSAGVYTDEQERGWRSVVDSVHAAGSRMFLQLWHTGRASHSSFLGGDLPVAPSAIKIEGDGVHTSDGKKPHETPRALETHELPGIARDYVRAAERAKGAGFDGVEVHSANGYLLDTFLQSKTNHRTDAYGGSPESRTRLLREVLDGVTGVFPADRVGVRLSPNGVFNDMGSPDFREAFAHVAGVLDGYGLAYLHVMDGLGFGFHELGPPITLADVREHYSGTVMGNCGYTPEDAEEAVSSDGADLVAFGRPYIANPDLVERIRNGWPLAESDPSTWYSGDDGAAGYTDYPAFRESAGAGA